MLKQEIDYFDGSQILKGLLCHTESPPNSPPKPGILVCPDWTGRNTFSDTKAAALANLGYVSLSIDVYGNGKTGATKEEKSSLMQVFMQDRHMLAERLLSAYHCLAAQSIVDTSRIAVIGFCFGGLCALDLARTGIALKAAVSFHGLLNGLPDTRPNHKQIPKHIQAKILLLHGYDDPMVRPQDIELFANEMKLSQTDWQAYCYGNTQHAFTNPEANDPSFGTVYSPIADRRSWLAMQNFFTEIF
jgi:dienelactone hydrolase